MDDYPYWDELSLTDQLWIAAFEAEAGGLPSPLVTPIREAAEVLEILDRGGQLLGLPTSAYNASDTLRKVVLPK